MDVCFIAKNLRYSSTTAGLASIGLQAILWATTDRRAIVAQYRFESAANPRQGTI